MGTGSKNSTIGSNILTFSRDLYHMIRLIGVFSCIGQALRPVPSARPLASAPTPGGQQPLISVLNLILNQTGQFVNLSTLHVTNYARD
jgi:hypothetical protein